MCVCVCASVCMCVCVWGGGVELVRKLFVNAKNKLDQNTSEKRHFMLKGKDVLFDNFTTQCFIL